jgi:hypothetical protein
MRKGAKFTSRISQLIMGEAKNSVFNRKRARKDAKHQTGKGHDCLKGGLKNPQKNF